MEGATSADGAGPCPCSGYPARHPEQDFFPDRQGDYGYIATESLNIKGMMQNRRLARAIGDAAWGEFIRQLQYKSQWHGSSNTGGVNGREDWDNPENAWHQVIPPAVAEG